MAVTKTHPIKSTLKAAIDYICNPEKTDGKLLVSSYGCTAETADIEFAWTRRLKPLYDRYRQSRNKEKFLRGNENAIILFEAAAKELKKLGAVPLPSAERMEKELAALTAKKDSLLAEYRAARSGMSLNKSGAVRRLFTNDLLYTLGATIPFCIMEAWKEVFPYDKK